MMQDEAGEWPQEGGEVDWATVQIGVLPANITWEATDLEEFFRKYSHCPLCGAKWSSNSICGGSGEWGWQKQNERGVFFPGKRSKFYGKPAPKLAECITCGKEFVKPKHNAQYCGKTCQYKMWRERAKTRR